MADVFNKREGILSWVSASGNSNAWATAASSPSGTAVAFVESFDFGSGQTLHTVFNRGVPHHQKKVQADEIMANLSYLFTGSQGVPDYPVHLELKMSQGAGQPSAFYQFHRAWREQHNFTEDPNQNNFSDTFKCLGVNGPTASGYLL